MCRSVVFLFFFFLWFVFFLYFFLCFLLHDLSFFPMRALVVFLFWSLSFPLTSPLPVAPPSSPSTLTSAFWKPIQIKTCEPTFSHTAPCIAESFPPEYGGVLGYEYNYRDFEISFPSFDDDAQLKLWLQRVLQPDLTTGESLARCWVDFERRVLRYHGQHGQTFIFRRRKGPSTSFSGLSPFGKWGLTECTGYHVPHDFVSSEQLPQDKSSENKLAIYAGVPDGHSWQHFMDRGSHVLLQVELSHTLNRSVQVIASPPRTGAVKEMYSLLNLPSASRTTTGNPEETALSCRCPLIHPYFSYKTKELVFSNLELPPSPKLSERKKIFYAPRGQTRKVLNEPEVLSTITEVLAERNLGEELVVFDSKIDFRHSVKKMQQTCAAFIGAHGGAMYNAKWCPEDTLVIEFIPSTRPSIMFYEESQMLQQHYHPMVLRGEKNHNVYIPIEELRAILTKKLGKPAPFPSINHTPRYNPTPAQKASDFLNETEIRNGIISQELQQQQQQRQDELKEQRRRQQRQLEDLERVERIRDPKEKKERDTRREEHEKIRRRRMKKLEERMRERRDGTSSEDEKMKEREGEEERVRLRDKLKWEREERRREKEKEE